MNGLRPRLPTEELRAIGDHWGLVSAAGILLVVCGIAAIASPFLASFAAILLIGFLMVVGGLATIFGGIRHHASGGLAFYFVTGLLAVVAGLIILAHPGPSLLVVTMLVAIWLLVAGVFRLAAGFLHRPDRVWLIVGGLLAVVLGLLLLADPATHALWFIGLVVGIELIFAGWSWTAFGLAAKRMREAAA